MEISKHCMFNDSHALLICVPPIFTYVYDFCLFLAYSLMYSKFVDQALLVLISALKSSPLKSPSMFTASKNTTLPFHQSRTVAGSLLSCLHLLLCS